jgi:hypothetical protein
MHTNSSKGRRVLLIALVVVMTTATAGVAAKMRFNTSRDARPAFTLVSRVTYLNLGDKGEPASQETRYVSSNGSFRAVRVDPNGHTREYFFELGRGYFSVNHQRGLLFQDRKVSPAGPTGTPLTAEQLRASPQLVRTEQLLGLTAYVLRVTETDTGLPSVDVYRTVELGSTPLKVVNYSDGKVSMMTEPVSVTWGEPAAALLKGPDYPVAQP